MDPGYTRATSLKAELERHLTVLTCEAPTDLSYGWTNWGLFLRKASKQLVFHFLCCGYSNGFYADMGPSIGDTFYSEKVYNKPLFSSIDSRWPGNYLVSIRPLVSVNIDDNHRSRRFDVKLGLVFIWNVYPLSHILNYWAVSAHGSPWFFSM